MASEELEIPNWVEEERYRSYFDYFPKCNEEERIDGMIAFMKYLWNTSGKDPEDTWEWRINTPVTAKSPNQKLKNWKYFWNFGLEKYYRLSEKERKSYLESRVCKHGKLFLVTIQDPECCIGDGLEEFYEVLYGEYKSAQAISGILYSDTFTEEEIREYLRMIIPCKPDNRLHLEIHADS